MKAMIFAAGLGTRMKPLTDSIPKALVEVDGSPLLELVIRRLKLFGIKEIIVNVHYLADQIEAFLQRNDNFGISITISDERELLLDTGGGLQKAGWFFSDGQPFLICNTDILSNIDIEALAAFHHSTSAIATLAVQQRKSSRYLLFDQKRILSGWLNTTKGEVRLCRTSEKDLKMHAFSAFQIVNPAIFRYFPKDKVVFSIIDTYLQAAQHELIAGFEHNDDLWIDVGTREKIAEAATIVKSIPLG